MPEPNTGGSLKTNIADMQVGDFIVCNYQASSGAIGTFSNLGGTPGAEIPVSGASAPNGSFYFIKVDGKPGHGSLLVADRVLQSSISWDVLNAGDYIQGKPVTLGGVSGIIRSLGGGNSYATVDGKSSVTDQGQGKAFPVDNEFDSYVLGFSHVQEGKTLFDVFHHDVVKTWVQETPIAGIVTSANRATRGGVTGTNNFSHATSSTANTSIGFRPVFEYYE